HYLQARYRWVQAPARSADVVAPASTFAPGPPGRIANATGEARVLAAKVGMPRYQHSQHPRMAGDRARRETSGTRAVVATPVGKGRYRGTRRRVARGVRPCRSSA